MPLYTYVQTQTQTRTHVSTHARTHTNKQRKYHCIQCPASLFCPYKTHIPIHTHKHTHTHTQDIPLYSVLQADLVRICIHIIQCIAFNTNTHNFSLTHTYPHICTHTYTYTCTRTHAHTCKHDFTHALILSPFLSVSQHTYLHPFLREETIHGAIIDTETLHLYYVCAYLNMHIYLYL